MLTTYPYFKGKHTDKSQGPETGGGGPGTVLDALGAGTIINNIATNIHEASGLVASRIHDNTLYTHEDSGSGAFVEMISTVNAATMGVLTLTPRAGQIMTSQDYEDIAYYGGRVFVADIGNNANNRTNQALYAFAEPSSVATQSVVCDRYPITIVGTTIDVEAFMIDPITGLTYLYLKANANVSASGLFVGPKVEDLSTTSANNFTKLLNHSLQQVTACDWQGAGDYYVINTNGSDIVFPDTGGAYFFDRLHAEVLRKALNQTTPLHPAEAICWSDDGAWIYRTYDGGGTGAMPLYKYPVTYVPGDGTTDPGDGTTMAAVHSQKIVNSFGVNIQPWQSNNYGPPHYANVKSWLSDLGVRRVRTKIVDGPTDPSNVFMRSLYDDLGIMWHATAGEYDPGDSEGARRAREAALESAILAHAVALEGLGGYNEPNGARLGPVDPDWPDYVVAHQQWLTSFKAAHGSLANVNICGPSMHDNPPGGTAQLQADYLLLEPAATYMENIEMHRYPGGQIPSNGIDQRTGWAVAGVGANKKPVTVTECGYNHATGWTNYCPNSIIGSYYPRLLMEHVIRGNSIYGFELFDQGYLGPDKEYYYGLISDPNNVHADQTPLKQYNAMKAMLALFADGDTPFTPTPLAVQVTGNSSIKTFLTQKRNGKYLMAMWRDLKLWDKASQTILAPAAVNGTIQFPVGREVIRYVPAVGTATQGTTTGVNHTVSVGGDLIVLQIS